jgi:cell fate (sporulation/competence/biofilm development) regulator YmcA (YheA/YmcA/DUF963 family)
VKNNKHSPRLIPTEVKRAESIIFFSSKEAHKSHHQTIIRAQESIKEPGKGAPKLNPLKRKKLYPE